MIARSLRTAPACGVAALADAEIEYRSGWWIHTFDRVDSTNTVAARLPAWDAVRAVTQTSGRGRTGRYWVSDEGGLWLSAVLPCPAEEPVWQYLPLAVGWGVGRMLRHDLGVAGLRLRWPNDLMVGRKKLAGLLVERFSRETIIVGIGINVFNTPESRDAALTGMTVRLADLASSFGDLAELAVHVLGGIRAGHSALKASGFAPIAKDLNAHWTDVRRVELTQSGMAPRVEGCFAGIDDRGALRVMDTQGCERVYDATQIALLRELD